MRSGHFSACPDLSAPMSGHFRTGYKPVSRLLPATFSSIPLNGAGLRCFCSATLEVCGRYRVFQVMCPDRGFEAESFKPQKRGRLPRIPLSVRDSASFCSSRISFSPCVFPHQSLLASISGHPPCAGNQPLRYVWPASPCREPYLPHCRSGSTLPWRRRAGAPFPDARV